MKALLAFLLITPCVMAQSPPLLSLVAAERGFAAATAHLGVRDGFLAFFADDAITFDPSIGPYRQALTERPKSRYPLGAVLRWAPEEGDAAVSDDMGYLTGPYSVEVTGNPEGPRPAGWYFSVWKRQSDSTWKVFIDVGIETPDHGLSIDSVGFRPSPLHPSGATGGTASDLRKADSLLNLDLQKNSDDLTAALAPSCRFHRNGSFPIQGTSEVKNYLRTHPYGSARGVFAEVSAAGDLGYAYGTYKNSSSNGYYVRIWKLGTGAVWKLVLDVTTVQQ